MKIFYSLLVVLMTTIGTMAQTEATIYEIQGQAAASPLAGQVVTTHGIVTGVTNFGFYIQDGEGAWNGVYVYTTNYTADLGDDVSVTAEVQEYYEMTELGYVDDVTVLSTGNQLPEPAVITAQQASMEDYEGVLARVNDVTVTVLPNQYGIWTTVDANNDELLVDDDMFDYNPSIGEQLSIIGIVVYTFSERKINPRSLEDIIGGTGGEEVSIYDIQGQTGLSPFEGQDVTTSGIVTGIAYNGYFIQDGSGPWNGIFVFDTENVPEVGDDVTVMGEVQEYYDMTELGYISSFVVNSQGNEVPEATVITGQQSLMEDYESVLVRVENVEVTELPNNYNEWQGTAADGETMVMDDVMFEYTPSIGDHLNITGCMMYSFSVFKLNPRFTEDIAPFNSVGENHGNIHISVFPNPATDEVTIRSDQIINEIAIFNAAGSLMFQSGELKVNSNTQDLSELPEGIYMIRVSFTDKTFTTQKIMIR